MDFIPQIQPGAILSNQEIVDTFKCGNMGGMRKSTRTNSLVLITDHTKGLYDDRWEGEIIYYTGMGKRGNQQLEFMRNKTLANSNNTSIKVFLFEVHIPKEYYFHGQVKLIKEPYTEVQPDELGEERIVWIFPLQLIDKASFISNAYFEKITNYTVKKITKLSDDELYKRAKNSSQQIPQVRNTITQQFTRNLYIAEAVKRKAAGYCQLCGNRSPFQTKNDEWYLECHHIVWLSKGGEDSLENCCALCPNCHKKMHILNQENDRQYLLKKQMLNE